MQSPKKLSRLLRELTTLIEEEALANPAFASKLDLIIGDFAIAGSDKKAGKPKVIVSSAPVPDVSLAWQSKGEEEFRFWLRDFDVPTLKTIIKSNGYDPGKISQRWTEPDKFIVLIVEQTAARLRRGASFLPPRAGDPEPSE